MSGKPSPFLKDYCFAVAPSQTEFSSKEISINIGYDNYFTNTAASITKMEIKCDSGNFETVVSGQRWEHTFAELGEHELTFRTTFSDGKVMQSHTMITLSLPDKQSSHLLKKPVETFKVIPADSSQPGAVLQAMYIDKAKTSGKFIRPLVIAGDMDFSQIFKTSPVDLNTILQMNGIGDKIEDLSGIFDIIYVKYNDSAADLFQNGELFRRVLKEVNGNRFSVSDDCYVIGLGVGGVISRIGLNLMEKNNEDHRVKKMIAVNAPFRGLNLPLDLQLLLRQFHSIGFQLKEKDEEKYGFVLKEAEKYTNYLGKKALQQLLIYYVNEQFKDENSVHNQFIQNELVCNNPAKCETVSIVNGYNNAFINQPYSQFIKMNSTIKMGGKKVERWFGRLKLYLDVYTLPNRQQKRYYDSDIRAYRTILGVQKTYARDIRQIPSTSDMLPLDALSGAYLPPISMKMVDILPQIQTLTSFCLIPSASSLDVDLEKSMTANDKEMEALIPFDRYYQASSATYGDMSGLVRYLEKELVPHIEGDFTNVLGATEMEVVNVPNIPLIKYTWNFDNKKFKVVSQKGTTATICPLVYDGERDMVSVTPSLIIPVEGLDFSGLSTPKEYLYSQKIDIAGDEGITSDDKYYELSAVPGDVESVEWTASEGVVLEYVDALSVKAHVDSVLVEPWIEASMTSCGVKHTFRKNLNSAMLSGAVVASCESWISQQDHKRKYLIHIDVKPSYLSIEDLYFCWTNDVQVRKENPDEDDKAVVHAFGQAKITTAGAGDVGVCKEETVVIDKPIVPDSTLIRWPPRGINPLAADVIPVEPGPDPIRLDPEPMGANEALVVMPSVSAGEIASGNVMCRISDSFGNKIELKIPVSASWDVVRHASYQASPNPASSTLRIQKQSEEGELSVMSAGNRQITAAIFDSQGLVKTEVLESGNDQWQMEVGDLPDGTYYLNVLENGEVVDRQIILIQH